jgi:molybdate transport system ATP-binding protein
VSVELERVVVRRGTFRLEIDARLESTTTALYGPSGAGKSTLVEAIAGLHPLEAGRIALAGELLEDARTGFRLPSRRRRVGWVPQDGALFPHLDVRGNVLFGAGRGRENDLGRIAEAFELGPLLDRRIDGLSGGERRRVALARALLASPRLLLLDEPLAGLDGARRRRILPFLERVRGEFGVPLVYVTHQHDEIVELCDEVLVLDEGRLAGRGPAPLVLADRAAAGD